MTDSAGPDHLVGNRQLSGWARVLLLGFAVFYFAVQVAARRWGFGVLGLCMLLCYGYLGLRPPTRVDADGVHRSVLRRSGRLLSWGEIAAVGKPGRSDTVTKLLRTDGSTLALHDIPAAKAPIVAAIGGKELKTIPYRVPQPVRPPEPREPSPVEVELDLDRRAAKLAAERARMADDLAKVRHRRSP